ncbi:MAG: alanine racemase [Deltaproteobacteria bacterium]|nr:MAG: alanine racemase [Deltaproteobacteria bacterium]
MTSKGKERAGSHYQKDQTLRLSIGHWGFEESAKGLQLGSVNIADLANRMGTPFYLFDEARLHRNAHTTLDTARRTIPNAELFYSLKTNGIPRVLEILKEEGFGAEAISIFELKNADAVGFAKKRMILNGPGKGDDALRLATNWGVLIQVESLSEARALARIAGESPGPLRAGVRINPDIFESRSLTTLRMGSKGSQFGLNPKSNEFREVVRTLSKTRGIQLTSLSAHIGTGIVSAEPFRQLARELVTLRQALRSEEIEIPIVNLGGGYPVSSEVRYPEGAFDTLETGEPVAVPPPGEISSFAEICRAIGEEMAADPPAGLYMEPGRLLVSDTFHLITRVNRIKEESGIRFAILDASRIQNALFVGRGYHEILHSAPRGPAEETYTLVGPLCADFDIYARSRVMPYLSEGDVIIVLDVGAYNLSAQSHWSFPPAPVVSLRDGEAMMLKGRN